MKRESIHVHSLSDLGKFRRLILACECACLLHDLGKLSSSFIRSKSSDFKEGDRHAQILEIIGEETTPNLLHFFSTALSSFWPKEENSPAFLHNIQLQHFLSAHHGFERQNHQISSIPFFRFLQACDHKSSAEDKANPSDNAKQPLMATFQSSVFGLERRLEPFRLDELRISLLHKLDRVLFPQAIVSARKRLLPLLHRFFAPALAETRRAANDLDLFHHSYSVATYFKTGLVSFLLGYPLPQEMEEISSSILSVKINAIDRFPEAKRKICHLLEEVYPVGNFFFQDAQELFFQVGRIPNNFLRDLERIARDRIGAIIQWEYFCLKGEERKPLFSPLTLRIPFGEAGVILGLRAFLERDFLDTLFAKRLEHIEPGMDFNILLQRTEEVMALARWEKARQLRAKIVSIGRHLQNLKRGRTLGKLTPLKAAELEAKEKDLIRARKQLRALGDQEDLLSDLGGEKGFEEKRQRLLLFVDRVFSWLHPPDPFLIARSWIRKKAPVEEVALRYILRKGPSLSRLMELMEEGERFYRALARRVGKPTFFSPNFCLFRADPLLLAREAETLYNRRLAKMKGRLPLAVLSPGVKSEEEIFRSSWQRIVSIHRKRGRLQISLANGDTWSLPTLLGNGERDQYYLYYFIKEKDGRGRLGLHTARGFLLPVWQLRKGDRIQVLLAPEIERGCSEAKG